MDWIQVVAIIGSLGGLMFYFLQRIEKDVDKLGARIDAANARIDNLYTMFYDLLKEVKK